MIGAYLLVLSGPLFGITSYWTYLAFLTVPWFITAFRVLRKHYDDAKAMSPANMLTIRVHNMTGFLLVAAYVIQGGIEGRPLSVVWIPVAVLVLLYLPVVAAQLPGRRSAG